MGNYKETPDSRGRELNLESERLQAFGQPSGSAGDVAFVEVAADHYTWWRQWGGARERNVGWRIDYVLPRTLTRPELNGTLLFGIRDRRATLRVLALIEYNCSARLEDE